MFQEASSVLVILDTLVMDLRVQVCLMFLFTCHVNLFHSLPDISSPPSSNCRSKWLTLYVFLVINQISPLYSYHPQIVAAPPEVLILGFESNSTKVIIAK